MVFRPTLQVLLVEDSEDDAFFFRWTLRKCDMPVEVVHVADGGAAIQHFEAVFAGHRPPPDVVFLDLKIPTFSGFEVLEWLRRQARSTPLHVMVLSGSEHANDVARAQALGADGYLVKPISPELLKDHLQQLALRGSPAST